MASVFKRGGSRAKGPWYIQWQDHLGRRRTMCTRTSDKATAERIAKKYEADAALRREGVVDAEAEGYCLEAKRKLTDLLVEYEAKLTANSRTERYVRETKTRLKRIFESGELALVRDLTPQALERYAAKLADAGKSARTIQAALGDAKSFTRWMAMSGKLPRDPLASVTKPSPENDRRRERRMLLPSEWPYLETATSHGPVRNGMSGSDRALLYRLAIQTGLRANELRSLRRSNVVLDATKPYVRVAAKYAKNGKTAQQFIDAELAQKLRDHLRNKLPGANLFSMPDRTKLAAMVRADLEAARDTWLNERNLTPDDITHRLQSDFLAATNEAGEKFDFHSLRHSCGSWMALSGAHPKTVQTIMRHSTPVLTLNRYGHLLPGTEAAAAEKLGAMMSANNGTEDNVADVLSMTGTDDRTENDVDPAQLLAQHSASGRGHNGATQCDDEASTDQANGQDEASGKAIPGRNLGRR